MLDQISKRLVVESIQIGEVKSFLPFMDLTYVRNTGVAFSSFQDSPLIVGLLAFCALGVLAYWFSRHRNVPLAWFATGLIFGGAVGNIIDRLTLSHVVDFLQIKKPESWPTFNLADVAIVIGTLILVLVVERSSRSVQRR